VQVVKHFELMLDLETTPAKRQQIERAFASLRSQRREELFRSFTQEARKRVTVQRNAEAFRRAMAS